MLRKTIGSVNRLRRVSAPSDHKRAKPSIASRLLLTDLSIAVILLACAALVAQYAMNNRELVAQQHDLTEVENLVRAQRAAAFETHVSALQLRDSWAFATPEARSEFREVLLASSTEFTNMADKLTNDPRVSRQPEFEIGPVAMEQLSGLVREILAESDKGSDAKFRPNIAIELTGNYRFLLGILNEIEDSARSDLQVNQASVAAKADAMVLVISITVAALILALLVRFALVKRWVVKPAHRLAKVTSDFAEGNVEHAIPVMHVDELQRIADALAVFRDMTIEAGELRSQSHEAQIREQQANIEAERKEREAQKLSEAQRRKDIMTMALKFETSVSSVVEATGNAARQLEDTAEQLASAATDAGRQASEIADASGDATQNVQFVAEAVNELSGFVRAISEQMREQSDLSKSAREKSASSVESSHTLEQETASIDGIATMIVDIASKTNLIALNAAIEAARAGESGAGFAVVASEVKRLAQQSSESATSIGGVLQTVSGEVDHTVQSISSVAEALEKIGVIADGVSASVGHHEDIATGISRNASEAATGTQAVNRKIADLAVNAEQAGVLSQSVRKAANELGGQAEALDKASREFADLMRSA